MSAACIIYVTWYIGSSTHGRYMYVQTYIKLTTLSRIYNIAVI